MPSPAATSGQPPGSASAATPSPSTAAHTAPDASTDGQMEAHEARMLGLPLDAAEEMMAGLGAWNPTQVRPPPPASLCRTAQYGT